MKVQILRKSLFTGRTLDQATDLIEEPTAYEVVEASGYNG